MTTVRFSQQEFEAALSDSLNGTNYSASSAGFVGGEMHYAVVAKEFGSKKVCVEIASSIGKNGYADESGTNSIRIWLADQDGMPLGNKIQRWVTRVAGWETRLKEVLDKALAMASMVEECPTCHTLRKVFVVKKEGKNQGRLFLKCRCDNYFKWLDEYEQPAEGSSIEESSKNKPDPAPIKIFSPSKYQQAIFDWVKEDKGKSLVVEALAGSGKTTTGVEMLKLIPSNQEVVFVAFNKHIAVELSKRAPSHVKVSTYHSLGYQACRETWGNVQMNEDKVDRILESVLDKYMWKHSFPAIRQLVSLVKANLTGTSKEELDEIATHYGIELNGDADTIFAAVAAVVDRCAKDTKVIDYDDMCWLPVYHDIKMKQYDFLFVDEAQDTNKVQIALALKSIKDSGRVVAVGDRFQSLYGFRGADVDAIPNLIENLQAETLPLSITYRNPKLVVNLVNQKFPNIPLEAAEWAKDGEIITVSYERALIEFAPKDMVLCRTNAPLVEPAFDLIRRGIKAIIRGRDIGKGLIALIRKMKAETVEDLLIMLNDYKVREVERLTRVDKGTMAQSVADKVETIYALSDGAKSITELEDKIDNIFSDENEGVVFSSVHRAKGLEAENVYILRADLMPHKMAKQDWEKQQERNIEYVALTRTLSRLIYVE